MDKTMRVGILVNNFSLLNKITRKIKNSEFNLKHLKTIPNYDHEVDIKSSFSFQLKMIIREPLYIALSFPDLVHIILESFHCKLILKIFF